MTTYNKFFISIFLVLSPYLGFSQHKLNINTSFNEDAPTLSSDGKMMIFQSNRDGTNKLYEAQLQNDGNWSEPKSIDEINVSEKSLISIGGPCLSYDGKTLFFSALTKSGENNMDIYFSLKKGNKWSSPENIGGPINSVNYEGTPSISADGEKLFFTRLAKGNCYKIMLSEKSEAGLWKEPIPLPRDINAGCPKFPRILSDGKTLLYGFKSDRGKDNFDLFRSVLAQDGFWGYPIPFDSANTMASEEFGTISEINELMYYVTTGDIYSIGIAPEIILNKVELTTLDSENKKAIKTSINIIDALDKTLIKIDSFNAEGKYQTTLIPGKKYNLEISAPGYINQTITLGFMPKEDFKSINKVIELKYQKREVVLQIPGFENSAGLEVDIQITNLDLNEEMLLHEALGRDGKYSVNLREGNTYTIQVSTKQGRAYSMNIAVPTSNPSVDNSANAIVASLTSTPVIQPTSEPITKSNTGNENKIIALKKVAKLVLKNIYFEFKSSELKDSSALTLNRVVQLLTENPQIKISINAYTDNIGSSESNIALSEQRAQTIATYLVSKGIDVSRLKLIGSGKTKPAASNNTEEGRAMNRRAELKIIEIQ